MMLGCHQSSPEQYLDKTIQHHEGIKLDRCPHAQVWGPEGEPTLDDPGMPWVRRMMGAFRLYKDGFLLYPGCAGEQPARYVQAMQVLSAEVDRLDKEKFDNSRKKNKGGGNHRPPRVNDNRRVR